MPLECDIGLFLFDGQLGSNRYVISEQRFSTYVTTRVTLDEDTWRFFYAEDYSKIQPNMKN